MSLRDTSIVPLGMRAFLKATCRPILSGLENVPTEGGFIVASNHLSFLDSVIIQSILPRQVHFFAKEEYFITPGTKGKIMRWFFNSVGSIPVNRSEQAASVAALDRLVELIGENQGVGIYPEGTRSRDGKLYRGKNGVGWLAIATGVPVVPVGLIDTNRLQPPESNFPRPARFQLHVGEPLQFEKMGRKHPLPPRREATQKIMEAIAELSGQERVDVYNKRPDDSNS